MVLRRSSVPLAVFAGVAIAAVSTGISQVALGHRLPDIVMVYLLGVVVAAMRFGYAASISAALLSVLALDFFFTEPYLSFNVTDKRYYVTFFIMLLVAFVISNLMQRVQRSATAVRTRELRTARLYAMSREVSIASSSEEIVRAACRHLNDTFAKDVSILLLKDIEMAGPEGAVEQMAVGGRAEAAAANVESLRALTAVRTGQRGAASKTVSGDGDGIVPLRASRGVLGAIIIHPDAPAIFTNEADRELFEAFATQTALAIERADLADDAQKAQIEVQRERLRNALLSSVSHDLRTPLAVVKGAVTALLDRQGQLAASRSREYLETISEEASRLNRLVSNLISMTSLEAGVIRARKEWQPLEEVIGVALSRLDDSLGGRAVQTTIAPEANLAPFDATLIEQVFINLVENAIRYTAASTPIEISVREIVGGVEVIVADRGPGVQAGQEEQIFEKFRRANPNTPGGMGLGLAICRGILTVHGGRIWCENRRDGGASFHFVLPCENEMPPMNPLPEASAEA